MRIQLRLTPMNKSCSLGFVFIPSELHVHWPPPGCDPEGFLLFGHG
jgi:hypothetical protein